MKLLIFGATGGTGRQLVAQALDRGHEVSAFAREPAVLGSRDGLRLLAGDVLDDAAVARAVVGHDAVLCVVGRPAGRAGRVRSEGTRNIVRAMAAAGPARLICLSTIGTGDTRQALPAVYRYLLVPLLLRSTFTEHERQEAVVRASDLDWTIVRAGALKDGEKIGAYRQGFPPTERDIKFAITRADVAAFMLDQITRDGNVRTLTSVSY